MVDESTSNQTEDQEQPTTAPLDSGESGAKPNVAVIAGAGLLLLIIAALAAAAVYFFVSSGPPADDAVLTPDPAEVVTPAPEEEGEDVVVPVEPPPVELKRVFTFRDIFEPLLKPLPEPAEEATPTPGVPDDPDAVDPVRDEVDNGTLVLLDVTTLEGEPAAVLRLDGQEHTLKAGEVIPGTPWQVVRIEGENVTMRYGDDILPSISPGGAITK